MNKDKIKRDMNKDKIKSEGIKMRKTTESIYNKNSLTVDTVGLQGILGSGRRTAVDIGMAAGAKVTVGRRVLWNVSKIQKYLDEISK